MRGVRPGAQATQLRRAGPASWRGGTWGGRGSPSSCTTFCPLPPTHCGILDKSPPLSDGVFGEIWKEGTGAKAQAFIPRGPVMRRLPRDGSPRGDGWVVRAGCLQGFGKGPGNPTLLKRFVQRGLRAAWAGVIYPQPPPRCCWRTRVCRTQQALNTVIKRSPEKTRGRSGAGKGMAWGGWGWGPGKKLRQLWAPLPPGSCPALPRGRSRAPSGREGQSRDLPPELMTQGEETPTAGATPCSENEGPAQNPQSPGVRSAGTLPSQNCFITVKYT